MIKYTGPVQPAQRAKPVVEVSGEQGFYPCESKWRLGRSSKARVVVTLELLTALN